MIGRFVMSPQEIQVPFGHTFVFEDSLQGPGIVIDCSKVLIHAPLLLSTWMSRSYFKTLRKTIMKQAI
jgi:hypothetical protein